MKRVRFLVLVFGIGAALAFLSNPSQNWSEIKQGFRENFNPATGH